jgi:heptosyltransferase-2
MHGALDRLIVLEPGHAGTLRTARRLRGENFDAAFILPNSFRSALIPWLARIPRRVGFPGHARGWMLTEKIPRPSASMHQSEEVAAVLVPDGSRPLPPPRLSIPDDVRTWAGEALQEIMAPRVALLPGAARGPAKEWPREAFIALGRKLVSRHDCRVVVCGSPAERQGCEAVADAIGSAAVSFAGRTGLCEWAAVLQQCAAVVANDSGGMHLAAAVGTPVVALYGVTNPGQTGPLGERCRILQHSETRRRDVARDSRHAREALEAIRPDEVMEALEVFLASA